MTGCTFHASLTRCILDRSPRRGAVLLEFSDREDETIRTARKQAGRRQGWLADGVTVRKDHGSEPVPSDKQLVATSPVEGEQGDARKGLVAINGEAPAIESGVGESAYRARGSKSPLVEVCVSKKKRLWKFARQLRNNLPNSERWFWNLWVRYSFTYEFSNQVLGCYIPDVVCQRYGYVIEIDGAIHDQPEQIARDQRKDAYFASIGFKVFRIKAYDQQSLVDAACEVSELRALGRRKAVARTRLARSIKRWKERHGSPDKRNYVYVAPPELPKPKKEFVPSVILRKKGAA